MKNLSGVLLAFIVTMTACQQQQKADHRENLAIVTDSLNFISLDSANKMLASYANSVHYQSTDTNLLSLSFDAQALRLYLSDTNVKRMKFMLAHTLNYINSGCQNKVCGYKRDALTLILAAYGTGGNYIYSAGNSVMEHGAPCPTNCPPGAAANPLLTIPVLQK